jgi:O-antigen ligase
LIALPHVFEDLFDLPKATLVWVAVLAVSGLWLSSAGYRGKFTWRKTSFDLAILAFALVAVLATIFSYSPASSLFSAAYKRHETLPTWLAYFLLFFAATNFLVRRERILTLVKTTVLASMAVSVYGILQHFGYDIVSFQTSGLDRFRSFSTFGNAVFLGSYLVLVLPLALSLVIVEENKKLKLLWLVALTSALVALAFTYTRGAWVGGAAALLIWLILAGFKGLFRSEDKRKWVIFLAVVLVVALLAVLAAERFSPVGISLKERVVSALEMKGSVASRLSIWRTSLEAISSRPLLGWGPETQRLVLAPLREKFFVDLEGANRIADRPHNQILHVAYSFGALGLLAYFWIIAVLLLESFSELRKVRGPNSFLSIGILAGLLGYLIQEQFAFSVISVTPLFWLLLGTNANLLREPDGPVEHKFRSSGLRYLMIAAAALLVIGGIFFSLRLAAADVFYRNAIRAGQVGDHYGSISSFRQATQLNPWEVRYLFSYGEKAKNVSVSYRQPFLLEEAVSTYERGLARYPADYDLYYGLGNVYFARTFLSGERDYSKAREAYQMAIAYEPYFVEAYVWLGKTYMAEGDIKSAITNLEKAISISPRSVAALDGLAQAYEKSGDTPRAISYLRRLLAIDPYYKPAVQELERLQGVSR